MPQDIDFSTAEWYPGSGASDPNRPVDPSFTPPDMGWFGHPMIDGLRQVAERLPKKIAIDDGAMRLNYAQLYGMVCRLSHVLNRSDVPPGAIGIRLSYDVMHPVAVLGCLAAGRPCLLMSRDHPADYSRRLAETAGVTTILVNAADARDGAQSHGPRLIPIEAALVPSGDDESRPAGRLDVLEPAVILSTSGSTGVPKLVVRQQSFLQRSARENIHQALLTENDRFLMIGGLTSTAVVRSLSYLMIGATLYLVDVQHSGMSGVLRAVRDGQVTLIGTMVSIMKAMVQMPDAQTYLRSLRVVQLGGEMMLQKDLAQIRRVLPPGCHITYSLAMTEASVARWFVPQNDDHDPVRVGSGYIQAGTEILVLDENGRPCAPGEIGELIVRSDRVAVGEWRDGKLVSDRFQADLASGNKRIYRTGDLVHICPDGVLVMHGRKDRMIKIRGQRIEPAAIEATMRDVPGVINAAVVAKPTDGSYVLYGFAVPEKPNADKDALRAEVRAALKSALPGYMQPSDIHVVDDLPLGSSGKTDGAALLRRLSEDGAAIAKPASVPIPSVASRRSRDWVGDAWRGTFGTAKDPALGFDTAGGDSLKFMQIVFRLEQLSGMSLALDGFDNAMSQDDMALALDRLLGGGSEPRLQGKPIFFVPGAGGDEPRLLQFRAGCGTAVSFHGLDFGDWSQWVDQGITFDTILDAMASRVQKAAPSGPLMLGGYSLGGQVALVLAEKLSAAGREIEQVLILDSPAISLNQYTAGTRRGVFIPPLNWREEWHEWKKAHYRGEGAFALSLIVVRRLVSPRWAPLLRWLARHRRTVLPGKLDFYLSFHLQRCILHGLSANWRRSLTQVPRISAPITVFRASARNDEAAWTKHSPNVAVVPIGGNHFTMFDRLHLADLCACFTTACTTKPTRELAAL